MKYADTQTLGAALGAQVREWREASQKRQGDIAVAARDCGLRWTQGTVAAIELGQRQLRIEEFILLPFILYEADVLKSKTPESTLIELFDLFPKDVWISLAAKTHVRGEGIRDVLQGKFHDSALAFYDTPRWRKIRAKIPARQEIQRQMEGLGRIVSRIWPDADKNFALMEKVMRESKGDTELKAARKCGVLPFAIALTAHKLWGHSLTTERDRQVNEQTTKDMPLRTVQALRGHVTRKLLVQLSPLVAELRQSKG